MFLLVLLVGFLYQFRQLWNRLQDVSFLDVRDETSVDRCPVLVCDVTICRNVTHTRDPSAAQCQRRSEEKKQDSLFLIKSDNLRQNRKRRIVHDDPPRWIFFVLIISARIERTDEILFL